MRKVAFISVNSEVANEAEKDRQNQNVESLVNKIGDGFKILSAIATDKQVQYIIVKEDTAHESINPDLLRLTSARDALLGLQRHMLTSAEDWRAVVDHKLVELDAEIERLGVK